ncbi:hypothetical protein D9Q98_008494 [Chlorella vulgaris]|uniref:Uncharacterized protein n=1 Tax=Chlorella vulgaris TaxID=3077 RepID=A0A9D4TI95_CHLVU|nr:hypothetical protein D9Q98_008494 [Chlorella vulgaris]
MPASCFAAPSAARSRKARSAFYAAAQQQAAQLSEQMSMEEELLADMLAAELLPRTPARCSSGCQDAAAAAAASLMPDGGAAEAAAMGAALQQLFPQASGITLCCPTPGCAGELTLASSNGQTSRQPCACGTLDLMHLASANTCRCILAGTANEQPTAAEQQQLSSFVAELGVQLTQLMKEQNETLLSTLSTSVSTSLSTSRSSSLRSSLSLSLSRSVSVEAGTPAAAARRASLELALQRAASGMSCSTLCAA